jgi:hypothetical protein
MTDQARENELWRLYCDGLEPVMEVMVKHTALATLELGVHRATGLLSKAFDLIFNRVTECLFEELDWLGRAAVKPDRLQ